MTQPVRLLFLHRDLIYHGGVPKSFLCFARYRNSSQMDMHVASFVPPDSEMDAAFRALPLPVHTLGDRGYILPAARLRRVLTQWSIQVIVCGSFKSYLTAKLAALCLPVRIIFWLPGIPLVLSGKIRKMLFRVLARHDTIVYISHAVRDHHEYPGHRGKCCVVYYGVEDPLLHDELTPYQKKYKTVLGIPEKATLIGYTAAFIDWKDHATLLHGFKLLTRDYSDLHLILIGTGPRMEAIKALAYDMSLSDRVHFVGPRADARRLLGTLDIYIHPAWGEGFGLAVAEAMLAGIPVVAARAGAFPEFVKHGEAGILFVEKNPADLAAKLKMLVEDKLLQRRLAKRGRAYCLNQFSPQRFAEELSNVFHEEAAVLCNDRGAGCRSLRY